LYSPGFNAAYSPSSVDYSPIVLPPIVPVAHATLYSPSNITAELNPNYKNEVNSKKSSKREIDELDAIHAREDSPEIKALLAQVSVYLPFLHFLFLLLFFSRANSNLLYFEGSSKN
jgi:hypothetical protein